MTLPSDSGVGPMRISRDDLPHASVVRLEGELDLASAPAVLAAVSAAVEDLGDVQLVLDMRKVSFIDSTGVRTLLEAARMTSRSLPLLAPSDAVGRVLDLTRLAEHFPVVHDVDPDSLGVAT